MSDQADRVALEGLRLFVASVVREVLAEERPASPHVEGFIGTREAARRAAVQPDTVLAWIARGILPASKPPGARGFRIRPADLEAFLAGESRGAQPVSLDARRAERARKLAESVRSPNRGGTT